MFGIDVALYNWWNGTNMGEDNTFVVVGISFFSEDDWIGFQIGLLGIVLEIAFNFVIE